MKNIAFISNIAFITLVITEIIIQYLYQNFDLKYLFFFSLVFSTAFGQQITQIVALDPSLSESSGILYLNQKIITHNDSQGAAALYEVDSLTGQISRTVVIANASNNDWEDLAYDNNFIYIGDFGNNSGNRTDLKIYRISLTDYWNTPNDTVFADTIRFSYAAQTNFSSQQNSTNWDCEAMTIIGDSIYLFSKNWINQKTYVYTFPKDIGNYSLAVRDSLPIQGLITSADFNIFSNRLALVGYTPTGPFIVEMDWNANVPISQISRNRYTVTVPNSIQVEAIVSISENQYYLTAENFGGSESSLLRLVGKNGSLMIDERIIEEVVIFPNPTEEKFTIQIPKALNNINIEIYGLNGQLISTKSFENETEIEIDAPISSGIYLVKIESGNQTRTEILIVQ